MTDTTDAAVDYETALLGAILSGYPDLPSLAQIVAPGDFESLRLASIWQAAVQVHADGDTPNPLTVRAKMGSAANRLPRGPLFLAELRCDIPAQAPFLASKVREQAIRRQIHGLGQRCQQLLDDPDASPEELIGRIRSWADEITTQVAGHAQTAATALGLVIDTAEHGEARATPTCWPDLTELLGGWYPGQLIVIGARPGVGKSIMLENAGTDVARRGPHVAFASLEMSAKEITQRTLAHTAQVELTRIRRGQQWLTEVDWELIRHAAGKVSAAPVRFFDKPNQTIDQIRAAAWETRQDAVRAGSTLGLVVVDYLQLITPRDRRISRQQQVGEMSRGLKQLAKELEVPVLAGAQLNRAPAQRTSGVPMLSDLREAGDIEQDADVVILLHDETVDDGGRQLPTGELQVVVAKNRQGPLGSRSLQKFGHYARITGAA